MQLQKRRGFLVQVFPFDSEYGFPALAREVGSALTVGTAPEFGGGRLRVHSDLVSKDHFKIRYVKGHFILHDLGSRNGTYLNGQPVLEQALMDQEVISAGDQVFLFLGDEPRPLEEIRRRGTVVVSREMARCARRTRDAARDGRNLIILGETGTGKEIMAALYYRAAKCPGDFVAVNCAGIPAGLADSILFGSVEGAYTGSTSTTKGVVHQAQKGVLFLDEFGDLAQEVQGKLLRFIETGEVLPVGATQNQRVETRFVAATNKMGGTGRDVPELRSDLIARLEDVIVTLPPLRERKEEIVPLIWLTLTQEGRDPFKLLTPDFVEAALLRSWPRNVRQLMKAVVRCLDDLKADEQLGEFHLADAVEESPGGPEPDGPRIAPGSRPSKEVLKTLVEATNDNVAAIARRCRVHRYQVYRWLKQDGLRD